MAETWTTLNDTAARVDGRVGVSILKKLNPIWWFKNDFEPVPPDWYVKQEPSFTLLKWYLRNPFQNAESYCWLWATSLIALLIGVGIYTFYISPWWLLCALVFLGGVQDKNYVVHSTGPVYTTDLEDIGRTGFMWKVILLYGFLPLPYVSYCSTHWMFHLGWNQNGKMVKKFNLHGSTIQGV